MNLNDLLDSKYLKKDDLGDQEHTVTIRKVTKTNVARDDEEPKYKAAIAFDELGKPMVFNKTNLKRVAKAYGNDTDGWIGKKIVVYFDPEVEFGGEIVGGLRVRVPAVRRPNMSGDEINRRMDAAAPRDKDQDDIPF